MNRASGALSRRVAGQILRLWALADEESLLLIILDDLRRANLRVVRVKPDITKGTSLAQEVPALIQFDLDLREPLTIGLGKFPLVVQSVLLCDKALNIIEDRLIADWILHESLLSRGYDRKRTRFYVTPNPNWGSTEPLNDIMFPVERNRRHFEFATCDGPS
jgi:hypothetical protein